MDLAALTAETPTVKTAVARLSSHQRQALYTGWSRDVLEGRWTRDVLAPTGFVDARGKLTPDGLVARRCLELEQLDTMVAAFGDKLRGKRLRFKADGTISIRWFLGWCPLVSPYGIGAVCFHHEEDCRAFIKRVTAISRPH